MIQKSFAAAGLAVAALAWHSLCAPAHQVTLR